MSVSLSALRARNIEPVKRNKDGLQWVAHRFPIKGGISLINAMERDYAEEKEHPIIRALRARGKIAD